MLHNARCVFIRWRSVCALARPDTRPKLAIQKTMLRNLIAKDGNRAHGALWLLTYLWLLRLPSEATLLLVSSRWVLQLQLFSQALPVCVCSGEPPDGAYQSAIWRCGNQICLMLNRRKNRQGGSGIMRRECSCKGAPSVCPVHVLWDGYLAEIPAGTAPWQKVSPVQVLSWMRKALSDLGVGSIVRFTSCPAQ